MKGHCGMDDAIFVGGGGAAHAVGQWLTLKYANRHGLIAGATGTGKTVTLQILAEGFSAAGVPVFLSDVKGDLSGWPLPDRRRSSCTQLSPSGRRRIGFDDYRYQSLPGDLLGPVRRAGPPCPHDRRRDGAAAAVAAAGADRGAGGRR